MIARLSGVTFNNGLHLLSIIWLG